MVQTNTLKNLKNKIEKIEMKRLFVQKLFRKSLTKLIELFPPISNLCSLVEDKSGNMNYICQVAKVIKAVWILNTILIQNLLIYLLCQKKENCFCLQETIFWFVPRAESDKTCMETST